MATTKTRTKTEAAAWCRYDELAHCHEHEGSWSIEICIHVAIDSRTRRENTQQYSWRLSRARTLHHRKERQNQIHRVVRLRMCVHGRNFADEFLSAFTNLSPSLPHSDQLQIFSCSSCSSWVIQLWDPVCSNKKFTSEGEVQGDVVSLITIAMSVVIFPVNAAAAGVLFGASIVVWMSSADLC